MDNTTIYCDYSSTVPFHQTVITCFWETTWIVVNSPWKQYACY
jgi:hypothetical protein